MEEISNKYLGEQKLSKLLLKFAIPCITGLLIGALYNIVDQIFIGNSKLGYLGNAATGISFPVICIANAFAWCIGDGAAAFLSICLGRKEVDKAPKCVGSATSATLIISIILSLICIIFCRPLMWLFGASDKTIDLAVNYFTIVAAFFPFYLLLNVLNGAIRSDGSPTYGMIAMLSGALINIILDPLFIFVFDWGIEGAAWATAIGQVISCTVSVLYFIKPKSFKLKLKDFKIDKQILKSTAGMGASTFFTQMSLVVISIIINVVLAKYGALSIYGKDIPISIFSIETKIYSIVFAITGGITLGAQPIFGYNYGARKLDRVKKLYLLVLSLTVGISLLVTMLFQFAPELIINLFGKGNELYLEFGVKTLRIYLSLVTITCIVKMTSIFFQSIGKSVRAVISSIIRDLCCFSVLAILLPIIFENLKPGYGVFGILYAAPIADFVALIIVISITIPFFKDLNKLQKATKQDEKTVDNVIKKSSPGVIITISREHGTSGKTIAKLVSEKLNIPYYYKELTEVAAHETGLDKNFIEDAQEGTGSYDLYLSCNVIQNAVVAQEEIIKKIADNGSCIIVGRAADYVLKAYPNVVNIFIHAPMEFRIKHVMEMYHDTYEDALKYIKKSDIARAKYYNCISGKKWGDAKNYDLSVSADKGNEKAADIIVNYVTNLEFKCNIEE